MRPNRRRLLLAATALLSAPLLHAQSARPKYLIGWLVAASLPMQKLNIGAFKKTLKELGYVEGRDYAIEFRAADGNLDRLRELARELVTLKPAVIVTSGSSAVSALQRETRTVPIVFGSAGDPVEQGFVKSLARPGGNITGVTLRVEISAKQVELAHEVLPRARRIVALEHEGEAAVANRITESFRTAALAHSLELKVVRVKRVEELERAFAEAARSEADIVIAPALTLFALHKRKLAELAAKYRLPLVGGFRENALEGALLSYYSDLPENWRHAGVIVDKILKGARPAELPLEQPDRFLLVINLRAARALGITIPPAVVLRADEVIE